MSDVPGAPETHYFINIYVNYHYYIQKSGRQQFSAKYEKKFQLMVSIYLKKKKRR